MHKVTSIIITLVLCTVFASSFADTSTNKPQPATAPMTAERLGVLVKKLDPNAEGQPGFWRLSVRDREVVVISDERAGRMRIISAVVEADALKESLLKRLLQANFDSSLDARYAIRDC